ncbi:flippase-like domain-containing protein [Candidatus Woesearchaeota archaeon]|nr:flippase-like domain-containing protein [Candidatus Woesearchaeota archaeon]
MKRNLLASFLSVIIGLALFGLVLKLAGLENIAGSVRAFSPAYFFPFLLVSFMLFIAATYRWKTILEGEEIRISIWTLLKYKFVVFGLNYLTPSARLGGEPIKILLMERQNVKLSKSFASVVVDNFVGMGLDAVVASLILLVLLATGAHFSESARRLFLTLAAFALVGVTASYLLLAKKRGTVFSYLLTIAGTLTGTKKHKWFNALYEKIAKAEFYMRDMLTNRQKSKNLWLAILFASLSWPLTVLQYKLALQMLGIDVSFTQILISIIMLSFTTLVPIPGALGVQEAGQFSAFKLFSANPHAGIALSLVLRAKDMLFLLVSFLLVSREGIGVFRLINKKLTDTLNGRNKRKNKK